MTAHVTSEAISAGAARWVARCDAGLSDAEQAEFERWLEADARHAAALRHYSKAWDAYDVPGGARATSEMLRVVQKHVKRRRHRRLQTVGASLAVLLVMAVFWRWPQPPEPTAPAAPTASVGAVVLQPERRTLPDGSIAELRNGTEIAVNFDAAPRQIALRRGAAHFQVVSNPARPFVVEAAGIQVRAVGTAFAVQLGAAHVEVLVTEGSVAVVNSTQALATVAAGTRFVVPLAPPSDAATPAPHPMPADEVSERLAWLSPRLEFSGTPLAEAVALMNRFATSRNGPKIRLVIARDSPGLGDELISGLFRADHAEAFVHVLEIGLGAKAERRSDTEILLRKVYPLPAAPQATRVSAPQNPK